MSPSLPVVTGKKMVFLLERAGFAIHHTTGSHAIMRHVADLSRRVTVPLHTKDLSPSTVRLILKQSGLTIEEFLKL